ncbi:MAG: DUF1501 domain-containing protein [Bernardetiaceae bacterium]|jgi:uncharacterized protein (DUF1501 family)|nr:DUF1501 domain-containing protein [Bernardetiaceae bacterium]
MDRRDFLRSCSAATALWAGRPLSSLAFAPGGAGFNQEIFVLISLRGGMDGLHALGPLGNADYAAARPAELRVTDPTGLVLKNAPAGLALHAKAAPFKELYDAGRLALVHACGLTNGTRSHFEAIDLMEKGLPKAQNLRTGWLARYLAAAGGPAAPPLGAVASSGELPRSLLGYGPAVSVPSVGEFSVQGDPRLAGLLRSLYQGSTPMHLAAQTALAAVRTVQGKLPKNTNGEASEYRTNAPYPTEWYANDLSQALKNLAQLIKLDVGLHVATVDFGGWDTHEGQAYRFPQLLEALARAVTAFYNDLAAYHPRLTVGIMSEFGRRLRANQSNGTDHGHGNVMWLLGQNVAGGRVYGPWPGLATDQLDNRVDLAVSTDYRTVLGEVLVKLFKTNSLPQIFPEFAPRPWLGVVKN